MMTRNVNRTRNGRLNDSAEIVQSAFRHRGVLNGLKQLNNLNPQPRRTRSVSTNELTNIQRRIAASPRGATPTIVVSKVPGFPHYVSQTDWVPLMRDKQIFPPGTRGRDWQQLDKNKIIDTQTLRRGITPSALFADVIRRHSRNYIFRLINSRPYSNTYKVYAKADMAKIALTGEELANLAHLRALARHNYDPPTNRKVLGGRLYRKAKKNYYNVSYGPTGNFMEAVQTLARNNRINKNNL